MPNGTVHSGSTDPTQATVHLVIVLVSRIQKIGTGVNNFIKMEGDILVPPTEMSGLIKVNFPQKYRCGTTSQIFQSDRTEP